MTPGMLLDLRLCKLVCHMGGGKGLLRRSSRIPIAETSPREREEGRELSSPGSGSGSSMRGIAWRSSIIMSSRSSPASGTPLETHPLCTMAETLSSRTVHL